MKQPTGCFYFSVFGTILWDKSPSMKRSLSILIISFCISQFSIAQDLGFRTTDIGAEYQWFPRGAIYNLHLAINARLNHSIQVRAGKLVSPWKTDINPKEKADGWGGGIGYRYYFKPFPYQFFIGVRVDAWRMQFKQDFSPVDFGGNIGKVWMFEPGIETGYTFIINDIAFFTPYISAGYSTHSVKDMTFGNKFTPIVGVSAGFRL